MGGAPGIITPTGQYTVIPGAYGGFSPSPSADVSPTERGALAVVAQLERFAPKDPVQVTSPAQLKKLLPETGHRFARLIWGIVKDAELKGSPSKVIFVRVNAATQAQLVLQNSGSNALTLKAYDYGVFGNQIWAKVEAGTTTGKKYTIGYGKQLETYDDVELQAFSLNHANGSSELATLTLEVNNNASGGYVRVAFTSAAFPMTSAAIVIGAEPWTYTGTLGHLYGLITATLDQATGAGDATVTITGTNISTGEVGAVEVITIADPATQGVTAVGLKDITSVVVNNSGAATTVQLSSPDTQVAPSTIVVDGTVTVTLDQVTGDADTAFHVSGTDKATGQPTTEELTVGAALATKASTTEFTGTVTVRVEDKGAATTVTLSGNSFNITDGASVPTVSSIVDTIKVHAAKGYTATRLTGKTVKRTDLDDLAATSALGGSTATAKADLFEAVQRITNGSSLVIPTRTADVAGPPDSIVTTNFGGGSEGGAPSVTDWEQALAKLEPLNIDHVACPGITSAAYLEKAYDHAVAMDGKDERQVWLGAAANETLATLFARAILYNHWDIVLAVQEIRVNDATGTPEWLDPSWLGLAFAAASASLPYGYPLTDRLLNIDAFRQVASWNPDDNGGEAIEKGLQILADLGLGPQILRQVTTYFGDQAPGVLTAPSRVGSSNRCMKRIRKVLRTYVGRPGFDGTEKSVERKAGTELQNIVADREITSFEGDTVVTGPIQSGYNTTFDFTPVRSTEFMTFTGNLVE